MSGKEGNCLGGSYDRPESTYKGLKLSGGSGHRKAQECCSDRISDVGNYLHKKASSRISHYEI